MRKALPLNVKISIDVKRGILLLRYPHHAGSCVGSPPLADAAIPDRFSDQGGGSDSAESGGRALDLIDVD